MISALPTSNISAARKLFFFFLRILTQKIVFFDVDFFLTETL